MERTTAPGKPANWTEIILIAAVGAFAGIFTLAYLSGTSPAIATLQGAVALTGVGGLGCLAIRIAAAVGQDDGEEGNDTAQVGDSRANDSAMSAVKN